MSLSIAQTPHRCLPRKFQGKNGVAVALDRLPNGAGQRLIDMYLAYRPRNSFQGLPPIKDEVCIRWVRDMLANGIHLVAAPIADSESAKNRAGETPAIGNTEPAVIGHAALFPVDTQKCEMLVVVCPSFQNIGIGTELVRSCIELAAELGFQRIWLPVDSTNVRARHVYRKTGFEYVSQEQGRELDMICSVRRTPSQPFYELHGPAAGVPSPRFTFPAVPHAAP